MNEIQKLLVANLTLALSQIQDYLAVAVGTSVSAAALAGFDLFQEIRLKQRKGPDTPESAPSLPAASAGQPENREGVNVPFIPFPVSRSAAHLVFWALCLSSGLLAGNSAHFSYVIAGSLKSIPGIRQVISTFPSVVLSPWLIIQVVPVWAPPLLSGFAVCWQLYKEKSPGTAIGVCVFLLLGVYGFLWIQLIQLNQSIGMLQ